MSLLIFIDLEMAALSSLMIGEDPNPTQYKIYKGKKMDGDWIVE